MEYIDVEWLHDHPDEPIRLVSELDALREETRKLEFFTNGKVGWAHCDGSTPETRLGEKAVPALEEINSSPEFRGIAIDATTFEQLWATHGPA